MSRPGAGTNGRTGRGLSIPAEFPSPARAGVGEFGAESGGTPRGKSLRAGAPGESSFWMEFRVSSYRVRFGTGRVGKKPWECDSAVEHHARARDKDAREIAGTPGSMSR